MTNTFRRHHKTIMWIIIVGTIVSFVYFLSPTARNSGMGGSSRSSRTYGSINGETITDQDFNNALQESRIFYFFNQNKWPSTKDQESQAMTNLIFQRLFIHSELKQMHLEVTPEAAATYTRTMLKVPAGTPFPEDKFKEFVKKYLTQDGHVTEDDFENFIHGEVGQQMLLSLFGMNGELITKQEAEFFFKRSYENMEVELVRFPATNYNAKVTYTPEEITNFYTNYQAEFRLPDRIQVDYISFDVSRYITTASNLIASNMVPALTNIDAKIDSAYASADPSGFTNSDGTLLTEAAAKSRMKENVIKQLAAQMAQTNVIDLGNRLADGHTKDKPITKDDMQSMAATNGLTVVSTAPFDQSSLPPGLDLAPNARPILFQLEMGDPDDQFKILPGTNGFFLVGLDKQYPSQDQPLDAVRDKVIEDFRIEKSMDLAKADGEKFENAVKSGLAKGRSFESICSLENVKPEILTPFSSMTTAIPEMTDNDEFSYLKRVAPDLPTGQSSPYLQTPSGGFVVFVKSRTPVDDTTLQRDLPTFMEKYRKQLEIAAYQEWLAREFQAHVVASISPAG